jgi:hypothetical protein
MWRAGELQMFPPTVVSLQLLAQHPTVAVATDAASGFGIPPVVQPRLVVDENGRTLGIKRPGDEGYDEIVDPEFIVGNPR